LENEWITALEKDLSTSNQFIAILTVSLKTDYTLCHFYVQLKQLSLKICPVNEEWIHTFVLEPYLQGCERVNRAWKGVDIHSVAETKLSLKDRVISWLTGVMLMAPVINSIIWFVGQTFGIMEKIPTDPFNPETPQFPALPKITILGAPESDQDSPSPE
jgi:hypothetical protein